MSANGNASAFAVEEPTFETEVSTLKFRETISSPPAGEVGRGEYHLTMLEERGLVSRLSTEVRAVAHESQLTWPEFRRDPLGFSRRTATAYGTLFWRTFSQRNVAVATLTAFAAMLAIVGAVWAADGFSRSRLGERAARNENEELELIQMIDIPDEQPTPDPGRRGWRRAGGGSKRSGEGGRGGRRRSAGAVAGEFREVAAGVFSAADFAAEPATAGGEEPESL